MKLEKDKEVVSYQDIRILEEEIRWLKNDLYFYKRIYENIPEPIILLDQNKNIINANGAACLFFETDYDTLINSNIHDFLYLTPKVVLEQQNLIIKENGMLIDEWLIELKNQVVKHIEFFSLANILPNIDLYILKDITSHKRLELERSMHLQLFNNIFNQVIDGIVMFDENGIIVNVNPAFCQKVVKEKDELIGTSFESLFVQDQEEQMKKFWNDIESTGSFFGEIKLICGREIKVFEVSTSSNVYNGLFMSILRDITEKNEMENKLRKSEQKFRNVFQGTIDGMVLWKDDLSIVDINEAGKKLLQITEEEELQKQINEIYCIKNKKKHFLLPYFLQMHHKGIENGTIELEMKDQTIKTIEFSSKKKIIQDIHLTVFRDITERLKMEDQLRKSDMLNVVGELAAGIAHEIRNPMTSLKGFIQLLRSNISGYTMYFNIITAELDRIESIINEFLVLAKPQMMQYSKRDIVQIMQETIHLLHGEAMLNNVQFRTDFSKDLPLIYCEPNRIKQVFINIIKNAIEVMTKGGFITISIQKKDENTLQIAIQDEGIGMNEEKLKKLGQPFYTTKERGTGLGLMVSYKIIEEHQGEIFVESEEGKGTTFHLFLPITRKEEAD